MISVDWSLLLIVVLASFSLGTRLGTRYPELKIDKFDVIIQLGLFIGAFAMTVRSIYL